MSSSDDSSSDDEGPPSKRFKPGGPTTFVTWNANGLVSRCLYNKDQLDRLLNETDPDVLCIQEVRIKAIHSGEKGTPHPDDYKKGVKEVLESTIFYKYHRFWSLADTKYSGTLTLVHRRVQFDNDAAFTTQSALSLLLKKYNLKREDIGLGSTASTSDKKKKAEKKQTGMKNFFAPKGKAASAAKTSPTIHQVEGRFQFLSFPSFDLINTYQPNNGTTRDSFQRRRDWDREMMAFLKNRRQILEKVATKEGGDKNAINRPLIWCGDMNVAHKHIDGTHWEQREPGKGNDEKGEGIYEWWRDESKCFAGGQGKKLDPTRHRDDKGIPSFTNGERKRFTATLAEADLADVWRILHPDGVDVSLEKHKQRKYKTEWDRPNWSWRGHLSKNGNSFASKYEGRGQRLDYFLLSPSSLATEAVVDSCEILGYGTNRDGFFCGSDHSATILQMKHGFEHTR